MATLQPVLTPNAAMYGLNVLDPAQAAQLLSVRQPFTAYGTRQPTVLTPNTQPNGLGQFAKDIGPAGFAALGAQAGQVGLSYLKTPADKYADEVIKNYQASGAPGLTGQEAAAYNAQLLSPVQALATEAGNRQAAQTASDTGQHSAADVARNSAGVQKRVDEAAQNAGIQIVAADIQKKNEELQEYKQALQQKSLRADRINSGWSNLLGQGAAVVGTAAASRSQKMAPQQEAEYLAAANPGTTAAHWLPMVLAGNTTRYANQSQFDNLLGGTPAP